MKLVISIESDSDIENPCEGGDGQWKVISFNSRHWDSESIEDYFTPVYGPAPRYELEGFYATSIGLRRKLGVGTAFILDYYEHGSGHWSLSGEGNQCRWDSSSMAGIMIWEESPKNMGAKTLADRAKDARSSLELYNDWANGYGLYFSIEDGEGEHVDSCGGFYNSDRQYMYRENISPAIVSYMQENNLKYVEEIDEDENEDEDFTGEDETLYVFIKGDMSDSLDLSDVYFPKAEEPVNLDSTAWDIVESGFTPEQ